VSARDDLEITAINTRKTDPKTLVYLLKYDSVYRRFAKEVTAGSDGIMVNNQKITTTNFATPEEIPWDKYGVQVVIDATGAFTKKADLDKHLKGSVKKVILTAPAKDEETAHIVLGVNDQSFDFQNNSIISNASCTTNCAAPMFKVIEDNFRVVSGYLTTIHAYTQTQSLLDDANKSLDRSRAAALNSAPSTTGAAKTVYKVIPSLKGKIDGMSVRVPVPTGSFTDITAVVEKPTTAQEVNQLFKTASEGPLQNILAYETEVLVSSDFIGLPYSCIFDANYTKVINGNFVKIFGWYDNEWGYSCRIVDLIENLGQYL
jgi:glyceraldehyde 3-phosphate dehydrogenase